MFLPVLFQEELVKYLLRAMHVIKVTHGFYIEHFHTSPVQPIPGVPAYTFSGGFYSDFKSWRRLGKARLVWPVSRHLISLGCCRKERFLNNGKVFLNKTPGPEGRMEGGREKKRKKQNWRQDRDKNVVGAGKRKLFCKNKNQFPPGTPPGSHLPFA